MQLCSPRQPPCTICDLRHFRTLGVLLTIVMGAGVLSSCDPPPPLQITPSDTQTVADANQITGRRVNLASPDCAARPSDCNEIHLLNQLDGFDIDPRITVRFNTRIDITKVSRTSLYLHRVGDSSTAGRIGLRRLVLDGTLLAGQPEEQLQEATRATRSS